MQGGNAADAGERPLGAGATAGDGRVTFLVTAFDRQTGKRAWNFELPAEGPLPTVHDKHNLASSSPVTDGERVYAWFATGQLAAIDLSGKLVWKANLGATYGPFEINWGHSSSPTVYRDTLILICYHESQSYLLALDARTGSVRWKVDAERGTTSYSTPLVVEHGGTPEIVVNSSAGVSGHDFATGAAAVALRGVESVSHSHAAVRQRPHLHQPRLPEQPLHGDEARWPRQRGRHATSCGARRRAHRTCRRWSTTRA